MFISYELFNFFAQNAFIPTMPHDYGLEAMEVNLGRWYGKSTNIIAIVEKARKRMCQKFYRKVNRFWNNVYCCTVAILLWPTPDVSIREKKIPCFNEMLFMIYEVQMIIV